MKTYTHLDAPMQIFGVPFFDRIRAAHPDLPILMMTMPRAVR